MNFIDSHVHLADTAFDVDREEVVTRAREAGAHALICVGESLDAATRAEGIARRFPSLVHWTAGIHPYDAAQWDETRDLEGIREHLARGAVAIGECGLDGTYDHAPMDRQRTAFEAQLRLAGATGKPVIVHTRQAVEETAAMIREAGQGGVRGVMHCFTGPRTLAEVALDAGWFLSFSGVITFKRWSDDDLIRATPLERILVETDAPYLAPVPHRGARNEPAWTTWTLAHVAAARGEAVDVVGRAVVDNAARLFGLAIP